MHDVDEPDWVHSGERPESNDDQTPFPVDGFDAKPVGQIDDLHRLLTEERVGTPVALMILRGVEKLDLTITPAESRRV